MSATDGEHLAFGAQAGRGLLDCTHTCAADVIHARELQYDVSAAGNSVGERFGEARGAGSAQPAGDNQDEGVGGTTLRYREKPGGSRRLRGFRGSLSGVDE